MRDKSNIDQPKKSTKMNTRSSIIHAQNQQMNIQNNKG